MSIDIDWEHLTTGPDGLALADSIREFIHDKFQEVALPRFIRSVQVHSFDFGKECPVIQLKDVCDPLPDFYEDDDESEERSNEDEVDHDGDARTGYEERQAAQTLRQRREDLSGNHESSDNGISSTRSGPPAFIDTRLTGLRSNLSLVDHMASPLLSRASTPGIPGGISNLGYFHLPLSTGFSGAGTQTPLAAVAGGTPYSAGWQDHHPPLPWENHPRRRSPQRQEHPHGHIQPFSYSDPSTRPSTSDSFAHPDDNLTRQLSIDGTADPPDTLPQLRRHEPDPSDLQIVLHMSYSGSVRLSLTAEILLDYPMPSFVGIPLKLNITGLSFDGVALIAYLRKRAHFCFLGPDDAEALLGAEDSNTLNEANSGGQQGSGGVAGKAKIRSDRLGGLLKEIRVESEIGQKESGKQVLKNVGKVEKFVLEQVRSIFEDEFVYPSFWTFLV
ncbi:Mitochondrial distribution and morphology protein 12 [Lignoscripta atroalba]|nr:Mitochondrial distribution and morphology protein 12 [Lignoscripta atroalba]